MKTTRPRTRAQLLEHLAEQTRLMHAPETPFDQIQDAHAEVEQTLVLLSFRPRVHAAATVAGLVIGGLALALIMTALIAGIVALARVVS